MREYGKTMFWTDDEKKWNGIFREYNLYNGTSLQIEMTVLGSVPRQEPVQNEAQTGQLSQPN